MKHFGFIFGQRFSAVNLAVVGILAALQGCGGGGGDIPAPSTGTVVGGATGSGVPTSPPPSTNTGSSSGGGSTVVTPPPPAVPVSNGNATEAGVDAVLESVDYSPAWTQSPGVVVATFDSEMDSVSKWRYLPGEEFPGAIGGLSEASGIVGKAARLDYDLGCGTQIMLVRKTSSCGRYVAMSFNLPVPAAISSANAVLSFDTRTPQGVINPMVRVVDSTGQTHQYNVKGRSIESSTGEQWRKVHLPVSSSKDYFGGANDGVLHPPVRSITLGAGNLSQMQPPGWVEFDNVSLINDPKYDFELKPAAPVAAGSFYPTYVGRMAASTYIGNAKAHDKALGIGIKIVRRDLSWAQIESKGVYNFTSPNIALEALQEKGMSVLWILDYGHPAYGGGPPVTEAARTAFSKFARAAAENFKGKANVVGFEVWNEPNGQHYWPNPDALAYATLFTRTAQAIRAGDPSAKIISGGLAGVDVDFAMKFAAAIQPNLIDYFAVHPYTNPAPEAYANGHDLLKKSIAAKGINKPVWDTEWGYSSYGDFDAAIYGNGFAPAARNRQAVLVLRKVLTELALNVQFMNIYGLVDYGSNPTSREANFGLLDKDAEEKPAYVGLRSLYSAQSGRVFKGFLPDVPPGVHVLRWDGASDKAFVIWSEVVGQKVSVKLPPKAQAVRWWNGTSANLTTVNSAQYLNLQEKDGPVFVTVAR